jgi:hypothetical protein
MDLPERTKQYYAELIRKGDALNYRDWLEQSLAVQQPMLQPLEVGLQAKQPTKSELRSSNASMRQGVVSSIVPTENQDLLTRSRERAIYRELDDLSVAWGDVQESRRRDAIYDYLASVFKLVRKYRIRGKKKFLINAARDYADAEMPMAGCYATIIRATVGKKISRQDVSKYSRVLRVAGRFKKKLSMKAFIKTHGGINACIESHTRC